MQIHNTSDRSLSFHFVIAGVVACSLSSDAFAQSGGLTLSEQGGPISGTAQAGQTAIARDASTTWLNPAGLTRLEGTQLLFGLQPFNIGLEFDPGPFTTTTGNDGGDAGDWYVGGSVYLAHQINDVVSVGFSVTAPYGLGIEYNDDWVGRYFVTETELLTFNLQPAVGFRLNDQWSLGLGLDVQYATFEQKLAVNRGPLTDGRVKIDGDNWELGATIGVLFEPAETTRFGLRYRSEMDHDLDGDTETFGTRRTSTGMTIPQSLTASAYHEINEKFAVLGDVGWTDWSAFDKTTISIDADVPIEVDIPRDWKDTWNIGLGVHYRPKDRWLVMAGLAYVSSAVDNEDRTPDIPVDRQYKFSVGVEHELTNAWTVGVNYTYVDFGDNKIDAELNPTTGRLQGDYKTAEAHMIGLYGSVKF